MTRNVFYIAQQLSFHKKKLLTFLTLFKLQAFDAVYYVYDNLYYCINHFLENKNKKILWTTKTLIFNISCYYKYLVLQY